MKPLVVQDLHGIERPVFTIDFESFYEDSGQGYSLRNKSINTVMYVRDPRFKAHGCSVIEPDGETYWVTHHQLPNFFSGKSFAAWQTDEYDFLDPDSPALDAEALLKLLPTFYQVTKSGKNISAFLAHNTAFDGLVASEHYGFIPPYYLDTMSMSRGEWSVNERASLKELCYRLGLKGKLEGHLEKTSGIRDLSWAQELALIPYAIQDSAQTRMAFENLYYERSYPEKELHIIDLTIRAFAAPTLTVNPGLCRAEIEDEDRRIDALLKSDLIRDAQLSEPCAKIVESKGIPGLMRSRPCFAELLRSRGVEPPQKHAKDSKGELKYDENRDPVYTYAFAKNDLELMILGEDPRVSDLVAAWTGLKSTIRKTRAETFLKTTLDGTRPLPIPLRYCGAHTMRWSGEEGYNPQNLPSGRDGRGSRLREAITAPPGYVLCVVDQSQAEVRVNAWLWGQTDLLELLASGDDPYSALASELYKVEVRKASKHDPGINAHLRPVGKAMELGLGFGMGFERYLDGCLSGSIIGEVVNITKEESLTAVNFYRNKRSKIVEGWGELKRALSLMTAREASKRSAKIRDLLEVYDEYIVMPNGLYLHYKSNHVRYNEKKKWWEVVYQTGKDGAGVPSYNIIHGAKMDENIVQCLSRIIMSEQALEIARRYRIVLLVHDEVVYLAREEEAEEALAFGIKCLRTPPAWCPDIPLDAEGGIGKSYTK